MALPSPALHCPTGDTQDPQENLRLCLQNTFLHVKDVQEEASSMSRSQSDSSLVAPPQSPKVGHVVFSEASSGMCGAKPHGPKLSTAERFKPVGQVGHVVFTDVGNRLLLRPPNFSETSGAHIVFSDASSDQHGTKSNASETSASSECVASDRRVEHAVFPDASNNVAATSVGPNAHVFFADSPRDVAAQDAGHTFFSEGSNASSQDIMEAATMDAPSDEAEADDDKALNFKLHSLGQCQPCHYVSSLQGCRNGRDCKFCHDYHRKQRPCKAKRTQCKRMASLLDTAATGDPGEFTGYMKAVVMSRMRTQAGAALVDGVAASSSAAPPRAGWQTADEARLTSDDEYTNARDVTITL